VIEQTAGIILAAGGSSRFGQPKQLLTWRGEPLVRHVAKTALRAGLNPVIVVLGAVADAIEPVIKDIGLRIVINQAWMDGVSTSIKTGLSALKEDVGGVIFLQADQPQIPVQLVNSLIEEHRSTLNPIVAPQIDGVRGNPVLFDQTVFPALSALEGDRGGRALFSHYPIDWVTWHDPKALMDIDSPGDYQDFLNAFSTEEVPG
jgi:molybdenum cofactor cytidylyltransferase